MRTQGPSQNHSAPYKKVCLSLLPVTLSISVVGRMMNCCSGVIPVELRGRMLLPLQHTHKKQSLSLVVLEFLMGDHISSFRISFSTQEVLMSRACILEVQTISV